MNLYQIYFQKTKYISLNKWSNPADLNLSLDFVWTLAVGRFNKGKFAPVFSIWEIFINKAEPKEKKKRFKYYKTNKKKKKKTIPYHGEVEKCILISD